MIEVLINFLFACIFVGSLYITPVRIRKLSHNNPIQIKQRSISIFISCLLCLLFVYYWCSPIETTAGKSEVKFYPSSHQFPVYILLGIRINGLLPAAILPLLLTVILFSGAITCHICEYVIYKDIDGVNEYDKKSCLTYLPSVADIGKSIVSYFSNWPNIRNTIIAPICEEFCISFMYGCNDVTFKTLVYWYDDISFTFIFWCRTCPSFLSTGVH